MSGDVIFIPFPRELYDDMVRFSGGAMDVPGRVADEMKTWMFYSVTEDLWDWDDRWLDVAERYAPDAARRCRDDMEASRSARFAERQPLIWKEVSVPSGTLARMHYQGHDHIAEVRNGKIVDDDGTFSPSEWASKVANGTSRNAWRDIWFKQPNAKGWSAASDMRDAARKALNSDADPAE